MAKIGFIFFADEFNNDRVANEGTQVVVRNPKLTLTPYLVPTQFSFAAIFSIYEMTDNTSYDVGLKLFHVPTGETIIDSTVKFHFVMTDVAKRIGDNTSVINTQLNNLILKHSGEYKFIITVDGNSMEQILFVKPTGEV